MQLNNTPLPDLPISEVLEPLNHTLTNHHRVVLEAPPGAGKTTVVPLAILQDQQNQHGGWLQDQRIIMLEPRRMAARAVAQRMASLINEPVGHTIGYRVRQNTQVSKHTRIEVITEGILTRWLLNDPALTDIGLLIFDEFHERSMEADMGLALALQSDELFRDNKPLRILVMSATLDGQSIAKLLGNAPTIQSAGKLFPVEVIYGQHKRYDDNLIERVTRTVLDILSTEDGSILVFLPGQGEIQRVFNQLNQAIGDRDKDTTVILPLYGALPYKEQQRAIEPIDKQSMASIRRKIVLATDIAETSLTIEGITVVVDSGLCREACFDPGTGMTRLQTRQISKDSSIQRMGRAGRTAPGRCYRLWSEEQQYQLAQHARAEILQADLAPLTLQLLAWGIDDIHEVKWLDTPPSATLAQSLELLSLLGAIVNKEETDSASNNAELSNWQLSDHGQLMSMMPTHPRLAHMLICGSAVNYSDTAALLAALLAERNPLSKQGSNDLVQAIDIIKGDVPCHGRHRNWLNTVQQQASMLKRAINKKLSGRPQEKPSISAADAPGYLLACAYPDRIARRKSEHSNHYLLSNGRLATIDQGDRLCSNEWLAVAELGGGYGNNGKSTHDRIYSAVAFAPKLFDQSLGDLVTNKTTYDWSEKADRFIAEEQQLLGKLLLSTKPINTIPTSEKNTALMAYIYNKGLAILPWDKSIRQWQSRIQLLHSLQTKQQLDQGDSTAQWPDVSDQQLLNTMAQWLLPYLDPINTLKDLKRLDLRNILSALLPWPLTQQLNDLAPQTITVPSGSNIAIDYSLSPPTLKVKLQEMFGCQTTPTIAKGRVLLMLHLLSPAQRPIQITQDLAGFWTSSYFEVQKAMKGRYPKHPWPDNPLEALPTKHVKRRL